jgi:hypothetical protein
MCAAKAHLVYAVNYGFHLLKNTEEKKVKPSTQSGLNIVRMGGPEEETRYRPSFDFPGHF